MEITAPSGERIAEVEGGRLACGRRVGRQYNFSDGWILGRKMLTLHDSGAYARFSPYGVTKHSFHIAGSYAIPNIHFDGYVVFTNRVPTTAMRGFGVTSVSFAVETHLARISAELGIDPLDVANEGKVVAVVPPGQAESAIQAMRSHERGREASAIGRIGQERDGLCVLTTDVGGQRVIQKPYGEQLPRIC